jgi:hypothetical protein
VLDSIRRIQETFQGVYTKSFEEWVDGFDRDISPIKSIAAWELMAEAYVKSLDSFPKNIEVKKEILKVLLQSSMGRNLDGIMKEIDKKYLNKKDVILIINNFYKRS